MNRLFLFIIILIISCKEKKQSKQLKIFEEKKNHISFRLTEQEKNLSYDRLQVLNDTILAYANTDFFLTLFNLKTLKRINVISFKKEGPNGLKDCFRNWIIKNNDSILFIGKYSKKIKITNFEGDVIFNKNLDVKNLMGFNVNFNSPLFLSENNLVIPTYRETNGRKFVNSETPVSYIYNFKNSEMLSSKLTYKEASSKNNHPMLQGPISCFDEENNRLFYVFRQQNVLRYLDLNKNKITNISFSLYNNKEYGDLFNSTDFSKASKSFVEMSNNFNMFYDKYKKLIYLIVSHGIPIRDDNGKKMKYHNKPFSILVFDTNLNKIGEQRFIGGRYELRNCFVTKEGLFISQNNPENLMADEDNLMFTLFKLK